MKQMWFFEKKVQITQTKRKYRHHCRYHPDDQNSLWAVLGITLTMVHLARSLLFNQIPLHSQCRSVRRPCAFPVGRSLSAKSRGVDPEEVGAAPTVTSLSPVPHGAHRVVLMRHGESEFNNANVFTGWCDVALTQRGIVEAMEAGQVFASHNLHFRKCYSSLLTRSIVTAQRSLEAAGVSYTSIQYDWRLNERHYGALQGLSKERTADRLGRAMVMEWRRSYHARPPLMTKEHPHYPIIYQDPRYRNIKGIELPLGESLEDCQQRVILSWEDIVRDLSYKSTSASPENQTTLSFSNTFDDSDYSLIVAHANSLRALVMHLDSIPSDKIESLNIPTAIPFYYDVDLFTGHVVCTDNNCEGRFRGTYISDDRKKRNFLERRRAANDPYLWALHDNEVTTSMLFGDKQGFSGVEHPEGLEGLEEEAKRNTQLFSSALKKND